jgi:DNA polymerase III subunit epsilon
VELTARRRAYAETPPPDRSTPWREADFCVVDLETTGLDPAEHEIVSFAALHVERGRVRLDDVVYRLVRPRRMPSGETIVIHGLRSADLRDAPSLAETLDVLLEALTGRAMVAHVASIETGFLGVALRDAHMELRNPVIDTQALAVELFRLRGEAAPGVHALGSLAEALGLPIHRPHEADGDALTTAQVFLALATHLDRFEPQTVGSLERLTHPSPGGAAPLRRLRRWLGSVRNAWPSS